MILYNITIKVDHEVVEEWMKWMREEHMPELMSLGVFSSCKLFHLLEVDESDGVTYAAQYYCKTMEDYQKYVNEYAPAMRGKGIDRFKEKFVAFRTLMEEL